MPPVFGVGLKNLEELNIINTMIFTEDIDMDMIQKQLPKLKELRIQYNNIDCIEFKKLERKFKTLNITFGSEDPYICETAGAKYCLTGNEVDQKMNFVNSKLNTLNTSVFEIIDSLLGEMRKNNVGQQKENKTAVQKVANFQYILVGVIALIFVLLILFAVVIHQSKEEFKKLECRIPDENAKYYYTPEETDVEMNVISNCAEN